MKKMCYDPSQEEEFEFDFLVSELRLQLDRIERMTAERPDEVDYWGACAKRVRSELRAMESTASECCHYRAGEVEDLLRKLLPYLEDRAGLNRATYVSDPAFDALLDECQTLVEGG